MAVISTSRGLFSPGVFASDGEYLPLCNRHTTHAGPGDLEIKGQKQPVATSFG